MSALLFLIVMLGLFLVLPYMVIKYGYKHIRFKLKDVIIWQSLAYQVTAVIRLKGKSEYQLTCIQDMGIVKVDSETIDSDAILKSQYDKIKNGKNHEKS